MAELVPEGSRLEAKVLVDIMTYIIKQRFRDARRSRRPASHVGGAHLVFEF